MKFIHLSDLHLGKRVNEISMTDEKQDFDIALETFEQISARLAEIGE